jgi:hypothetical protein
MWTTSAPWLTRSTANNSSPTLTTRGGAASRLFGSVWCLASMIDLLGSTQACLSILQAIGFCEPVTIDGYARRSRGAGIEYPVRKSSIIIGHWSTAKQTSANLVCRLRPGAPQDHPSYRPHRKPIRGGMAARATISCPCGSGRKYKRCCAALDLSILINRGMQ